MSLDISKFDTTTHVRKPFEVTVVEVTNDNIEELSEFIGKMDSKGGTPFIQSEKKLVGNTFKVWPGFFVTLLNNKVRCYSRRAFFEQFTELTPEVQVSVDHVLGNSSYGYQGDRDTVKDVKVVEELGVTVPIEVLSETTMLLDEEPVSEPIRIEPKADADLDVNFCEHGAPAGECVYKTCEGPAKVHEPEEDYVEVDGEVAPTPQFWDQSIQERSLAEWHDDLSVIDEPTVTDING